MTFNIFLHLNEHLRSIFWYLLKTFDKGHPKLGHFTAQSFIWKILQDIKTFLKYVDLDRYLLSFTMKFLYCQYTNVCRWLNQKTEARAVIMQNRKISLFPNVQLPSLCLLKYVSSMSISTCKHHNGKINWTTTLLLQKCCSRDFIETIGSIR